MKPQWKCSIWYYKNNNKSCQKDDYMDWIQFVEAEETQRI
jgi:hypothetical protein